MSDMTNDTDAGKRLSDAELAQIAERHKLENAKGSNLWSNWYECNAQREKLLSHIAALTANRGSVSEERVREFAEYPVTIWQVLIDGKITPTEMVCMPKALRDDAIAAIQQAASECSGGGAGEMRETAALHCDHEAESYERLAEGYEKDDNDSAMHDCVVILGAFKSAAKAIRALPLPPSPVKESRDAVIEECAQRLYKLRDEYEGTSNNWSAFNFAAQKISALKTTPHQGGEGK